MVGSRATCQAGGQALVLAQWLCLLALVLGTALVLVLMPALMTALEAAQVLAASADASAGTAAGVIASVGCCGAVFLFCIAAWFSFLHCCHCCCCCCCSVSLLFFRLYVATLAVYWLNFKVYTYTLLRCVHLMTAVSALAAVTPPLDGFAR